MSDFRILPLRRSDATEFPTPPAILPFARQSRCLASYRHAPFFVVALLRSLPQRPRVVRAVIVPMGAICIEPVGECERLSSVLFYDGRLIGAGVVRTVDHLSRDARLLVEQSSRATAAARTTTAAACDLLFSQGSSMGLSLFLFALISGACGGSWRSAVRASRAIDRAVYKRVLGFL